MIIMFESESIGAKWGHIPIPIEDVPFNGWENFMRGHYSGYFKREHLLPPTESIEA